MSFQGHKEYIASRLRNAPDVDVGEWHAMDVSGNPMLITKEVLNMTVSMDIPETMEELQESVMPNLPWAEAQFQERVSGEPLNPGETYKLWPWQSQMDKHRDKKFSHTYMERFWPKYAGEYQVWPDTQTWGLRYRLGDLDDVVQQLARNPLTRQAYLPVFFPEDTGNVNNVRIPCTLGYWFVCRKEGDETYLHMTYHIRSCDFIRHFADDVYLAARLCQWVLEQVKIQDSGTYTEAQMQGEEVPDKPFWWDVKPGILTMHIGSLHVMKGDMPKLMRGVEDAQTTGS